MMDFAKLTADPEAMKHFGSTMVMWDFHARQPKKIFEVPGAPLEIRWAWGDKHNYAFTASALTSKLWLVYQDDRGEWQAKDVATIGNVKGSVLPVDISLSADDKTLFVDCTQITTRHNGSPSIRKQCAMQNRDANGGS